MQQTQATSQLYSAYRSRSSKTSSLGSTINSPSINGNHIKLGPIQFRLCRIGRRARGGGRGREKPPQSALGKLLDNRFNCRFVVYILLWRIWCRIRYAFPWPPLQHSSSDRKGLARFGVVELRCLLLKCG